MIYPENKMCKSVVCRQEQCIKKESYVVTWLLLMLRITQYWCVVFYSLYSTNMIFSAELYIRAIII